MSDKKMQWENAEKRFLECYSGFASIAIGIVSLIVAILLWMFVFVVMDTGLIVGILAFIFLAIAAFVAIRTLKKMLL